MSDLTKIPIASLTQHNCSNSPNYDKAHFPKLFTGFTHKDTSLKPYPVDSNKRDDGLTPAAPMHISDLSLRTLMPPTWKGKIVKFGQYYLYNGQSHPEIGYHNDEPLILAKQIADSRGADVNTVDLYGINFKGAGNDFVLDNIVHPCAQHNQTLYATFDTQCLTAPSNRISPDQYQSALISYINHIADKYFPLPVYERFRGRPLLGFWGFGASLKGIPLDWVHIKSQVRGNPLFILYQASGLTLPGSDGAMSWVPVSTQPGNPSGSNYLRYMLGQFAVHPDKIPISSFWARFNGTKTRNPNWSDGKHLDGMGGMTLLETIGLNATYSLSHDLPYMQFCWDDNEEGDDPVAGVENDVVITAQLPVHPASSLLTWSVTGHEQTVSRYEIYAQEDDEDVYKLGTVLPGEPKMFDLHNALVDFSEPNFYVYAVGQPMIQNHLVKAS